MVTLPARGKRDLSRPIAVRNSRFRATPPATDWAALLTLLHGRALYLAPSALPRRAHAKDHAVAVELHQFRTRLHRQRAVLTTLRGLAAAAALAIILLVLRIRGTDLPLPTLPLAAAAGTFLAALCTVLWQRPSPGRMAHALDQRMNLREQIGSALEIEPSAGRMAALLHERAQGSLRTANLNFVLPWPSVRRERNALIVLALALVPCVLLAYHTPLPRHATAASPAHVARNGQHALARRGSRLHLAPIALRTLHNSTHNPVSVGGRHAGRVSIGSVSGAGRQTGTAGRSGNLGVRVAQGQGRIDASGARAGTLSGAAPASGGKSGLGANLHLAPGKNSSAGGVLSPAQQALMNLQSVVSNASNGQQEQSGSSPNSTLSSSPGTQGLNNPGTGSGQSGQGRQPSGQFGPNGPRGRGVGPGQRGAGAPYPGSAAGAPGQEGAAGADPEMNRFGRRAGGGATGPQSAPPQDSGNPSNPQLGTNSSIVLNGANGRSSRMVVSVGTPNRSLGQNSGSLYGGTNAPQVTVPGYVAPDSNVVTADERGLVQGYFSPPSGQ